ncbi:MAG TPA: hypothetical protein VLZ06_04045 [Solirubrobacteraceae bacterium]|nr:hypothetical protein [Solirubrobacteraceae bacterium]
MTRGRRITVRVLVWGTTLLAIIGMFAVWADRQMFSADNWANTSTKLLQNERVRDATSNYLVEQLYANVNVEEEIKKRLPKAVQPLAGPISGGIRTLANEVAKRTLATAKVQEAWKTANRAADQTLVNIVEGRKGAVAINGGVVTLDLASILTNITNRLGLPEVSSKLPPSVAHLTVLKSKQIKAVQDIGKALKGLALLFTILVPVLYAIAIFLAKGFRRRTLMNVGIGFVIAGVVVFLLRTLVVNGVTDSLVKTEAVKPAAHAALKIGTSMLAEIAGAFVVIGVPLIGAAWFAGPARYATRGRQFIAPFLLERPEWTYGIVAAIMLLIFIWNPIPSTGKPAGIIVYSLLAFFGAHLLRRQTAEEFPPP